MDNPETLATSGTTTKNTTQTLLKLSTYGPHKYELHTLLLLEYCYW